MSTPCRGFRPDCTFIAVLVSLVVGIVTAFLRITGTITLAPAFLQALLAIAVGYLAVVLVSGAVSRDRHCEGLCNTVTAFLSGVVGTILLAIVLLNIEFAVISIIGAILTGALLFFFFLTVTSTACLVRCFFNCED